MFSGPYHVSLPSKGSVLKKSDVSSDLPEKLTTSESGPRSLTDEWLPSNQVCLLQSRRTKEVQDLHFRLPKESSFLARGKGFCFFTFSSRRKSQK
ncbi:hypothetical protein AVEN_45123-1 [Araneus ventricosus]|uniref:Uncharacterized protein n=1 Tax=Araneus ventricosus TaxID=182803 RepID=A0A4Y2MGT5_ARAVE|nr:hypothetical protein AVEN_45123-1 [Araneus ventricosus]